MFNRFSLEWRMRSPLFRWTVNLILTATIFIAATIGGSLGIKGIPLEISLVWPATGFSLAAVLLFGFKVLPGVFLGNFCYNVVHLYSFEPSLLSSFIAGGFISVGSTFQAFLGGYIIRRYCFYEYFSTLKDVLIFLIPAGLLTCIVASTIGNFTLLFYGGLIEKDVFYTWMTFWLGDLMGIYIFTPLLVVWTLQEPIKADKEYLPHAILISAIFILVSYLTFGLGYQLTHLYLPLCIWATYCFSMHGATLAVFLTSLLTVVLTSQGLGPFVSANHIDPLFFLVSFLEVNVATSLIVAAVLKEKQQSRKLIVKQNADLQEEVHHKLDEIREIYNEMFLKEKQASLGMMTFDVLKQILSSLEEIRKTVKQSSGTITQLKEGLQIEKTTFSSPIAPDLLREADFLEKSMALILSSEEHANQIAKTIQELISHSSTEKPEIKTVNLHTLLNNCVEQAIEKMRTQDDTFRFTVDKNFNRIVTNITALPWELAYAFDQFINHSLYSLKHKKEIIGEPYEPKLEIVTLATNEGFEIVFKDNGRGVPEKKIQTFFVPYLENDNPEGEEEYGLLLAYYIIVNIHHGQIRIESEEGNYLHLTIALPRSPYPVNASHPQ